MSRELGGKSARETGPMTTLPLNTCKHGHTLVPDDSVATGMGCWACLYERILDIDRTLVAMGVTIVRDAQGRPPA